MGWDNKLVRSYPRERKGWIIGALSLIALFHLSHVLSEDRQPTGDQAENTAPGDSPPMLPEITAPADSPPKLPGRLEYRLALVVEANAVGEILVGTSLRVNSVLALVDKARYFRLAEKAEMVNKVEPDLRLTGGEFERMSQQLIYVGLTFESAGGRLPEAADRHALKNRLKETSEFKVDKVARLAKVLGLEGTGVHPRVDAIWHGGMIHELERCVSYVLEATQRNTPDAISCLGFGPHTGR